jgi:hypothetical protein
MLHAQHKKGLEKVIDCKEVRDGSWQECGSDTEAARDRIGPAAVMLRLALISQILCIGLNWATAHDNSLYD